MLGMWFIWLDAYYNSKIDAVGQRDMGSWRAVMDLTEALTVSLNNDVSRGQDTDTSMIAGTKNLGNSEIRRRVRRESGREKIGYMGSFWAGTGGPHSVDTIEKVA
jgi:hypothetical protein